MNSFFLSLTIFLKVFKDLAFITCNILAGHAETCVSALAFSLTKLSFSSKSIQYTSSFILHLHSQLFLFCRPSRAKGRRTAADELEQKICNFQNNYIPSEHFYEDNNYLILPLYKICVSLLTLNVFKEILGFVKRHIVQMT